MKIYVNLGNVTNLTQDNGDRINEISLYLAMNRFADVYYNEQLFDSNKKNFGINPNIKITLPKQKYDFYYVRFNPELFLKLPSPKAYLGVPYHEKCFREADAIVSFTKSWQDKLKNFDRNNDLDFYNSKIILPNDVILFDQVITDEFVPRQGAEKTKKYRKSFGGDFIIAHFGRISPGTFPHSLLKVLPRLRRKYKDIKIQFIHAGKVRGVKTSEAGIKNIPLINHADMSYAISACDLVVCNSRQPAANWAGCKDMLEAMACGVPIMSGDYDVRKEQFGTDYDLFWPQKLPNNGRISREAEDKMFEHISRLIDDSKFKNEIGQKLLKRSHYYRMNNSSERMKQVINKVIEKNGKS